MRSTYLPKFPPRFGCIENARSLCCTFFTWHNREHRHSGVRFLTPEMVHYGKAGTVIEATQDVLLDAFTSHTEHFANQLPHPRP